MPSVSEAEAFVTLKTGLVVPMPAVLLALDLEHRGCRLEVDADALVISPRDLVTDADRVQIRRWREHLKAIVTCADAAESIQ